MTPAEHGLATLSAHFDIGGGWGPWLDTESPFEVSAKYSPAFDVYYRRLWVEGKEVWQVSTRATK